MLDLEIVKSFGFLFELGLWYFFVSKLWLCGSLRLGRKIGNASFCRVKGFLLFGDRASILGK